MPTTQVDVVLHLDRPDDLLQQVERFRQQMIPLRLHLLYSGTEPFPERIRSRFERVITFSPGAALPGFHLFPFWDREFVYFLNGDWLPQWGVLEHLVRAAQFRDTFGVLGQHGTHYAHEEATTIPYARVADGFIPVDFVEGGLFCRSADLPLAVRALASLPLKEWTRLSESQQISLGMALCGKTNFLTPLDRPETELERSSNGVWSPATLAPALAERLIQHGWRPQSEAPRPRLIFSTAADFALSDITFVMHVYQDGKRAKAAVRKVRNHYPDSPILVIADGDLSLANDPDWDSLQVHRFIDSQRLILAPNGPLMALRMIDLFLRHPTRWLVLIDPDTLISRPFTVMVDGSCLFGTIQTDLASVGQASASVRPSVSLSIQGGCLGMTHSAVHRIQPHLEAMRSQTAETTWATSDLLRDRVQRQGLIALDWVLGHAAHRAHIPLVKHPEIQSQWGEPVPTQEKWAAIHPAEELLSIPPG